MFYNEIYKINFSQNNNILKKKLSIVLLELVINSIIFLFILLVAASNKTDFFSYITGYELFWSAFIVFAICIGEYILSGELHKSKSAKVALLICWLLSFITLGFYLLVNFGLVVGETYQIFFLSVILFVIAEACNFISVV